GESEQLDLQLTLLGGTTALFSGSTRATITAGVRDPPPIDITTAYVGPGADVVALTLAPLDTIVRFGEHIAFRVRAEDDLERTVPQFFVFWSSDNPTIAPTAAGTMEAGTARATVRVTARTPNGISAATNVQVVAPPA